MTNEATKIEDLIIIGSGPAGLAAAIYASRANLNPLLIAGEVWGGQLMNTSEVENYPGFHEGIMGPVLIGNMVNQAKKFGTRVEYKNVVKVEFKAGSLQKVYVGTSDNPVMYESRAVIVASGAKPRKLGVPGENEYWGKGVSSCATCDGAFFRDKVVAVVGGGDSAMEEANFLTRFATKVYLIHRRDEFRASKIMQQKVFENPKVEIVYDSVIEEVLGGGANNTEGSASAGNALPIRANAKVSALKVKNVKTNAQSELKVDGLFLAIGYIPETEIFREFIDVDKEGYAKPAAGEMSPDDPMHYFPTMSKVDGVFIAGDVEDKRYRQAITAAADGCKAALDAERWLVSTAK